MASGSNNTNAGIIAGAIIAALIVVGGYYFIHQNAGPDISIKTPGGSISADIK